MRVDPSFSLATPPSSVQRRGATSVRFTLATARASKSSGPAASAPLATLDALLALQGEGDPGERRRRSVKRGHALLDALDHLKAALLGGRVAAADLRAIVSRLSDRGDLSGDPRLDELLAHIDLRAQVELAKLGAARG